MRRALVVAVSATAVAAVASAGSAVAQTASKTKTLKGGYSVTLVPDPTMEATGQLGKHCLNVDPAAVDNHPLALPGKGMLTVALSSPAPNNNLDWDLYLLDAKGNVVGTSDSPGPQEQIITRAQGKVTIRACNLMGEPTASVKYTFKYKS
jgi:hypothetical protein